MFEPLDLLAQGRLGYSQEFGSTGEVARLGYRDKITQMTKFHIKNVSK
jgi:hypothetical protein